MTRLSRTVIEFLHPVAEIWSTAAEKMRNISPIYKIEMSEHFCLLLVEVDSNCHREDRETLIG